MRFISHVALTLVMIITCSLLVSSVSAIPSHQGFKVLQDSYETHLPLIITDDSDFVTYGFEGEGTPDNPFILEGIIISHSSTCIEIEDIDSHFIIRNCWFETGDYGTALSFRFVQNAVISNCWIVDGDTGIEIWNSVNVTISNNHIVSTNQGLRSSSCYNSSYMQNDIVANNYGMEVDNAHYSTISENRIYSNSREGLVLSYGSYNNTITDNILGWNDPQMALFGEANAIDRGESNFWSGNHYSDYTGFGDYSIDGEANATDEFPVQLQDRDEPALLNQEAITLFHNSPLFNLTFVEDYPLTYEIYIDEERIDDGYYIERTIDIDLNGFDIGTYNVTIALQDGAGNEATFVLEVQILRDIPASDIFSILLTGVGISVILVVVVIWEKILRPRRSS